MTGRAEQARATGAQQGLVGRLLTWTNAALGGFLAIALWGVVAMSLATAGGSGTAGGGVRLAVLPFTNRGAADDAYFVDGVADQIRGTLSNIEGFQVIARSSSDQYRETTKSPADIGKELNVEYLLSATVSWIRSGETGGRVQVVPELIEVRTGAVKWQQAVRCRPDRRLPGPGRCGPTGRHGAQHPARRRGTAGAHPSAHHQPGRLGHLPEGQGRRRLRQWGGPSGRAGIAGTGRGPRFRVCPGVG